MPCTRRTASRVYKWKLNSPSPVTAGVIVLRNTRKFVFVTLATLGIVSAILVVVFSYYFIPLNSTVSVSPDNSWQVVIRENRFRFIDRNFRVVLINTANGIETELFSSWDQFPLIESEQFVWSKDSRKFALIGDRYYVVDNSELPSGKTVFLVYDMDSRELFCNTDHTRDYESISGDDTIKVIGKPM